LADILEVEIAEKKDHQPTKKMLKHIYNKQSTFAKKNKGRIKRS